MDALILSCGTGGGHNAAGQAVFEELKRRGHHAEMFDPYTLVGNRLSRMIANVYIRMVQKAPHMFGFLYRAGNIYRKLPFRSPVYFCNKKPAEKLEQYLSEHHTDLIVMPHLFPAEIMTCLKNKGVLLPRTIFVATDYTCIPFTEETDCDYYIVPHEDLIPEFAARGIAPEKLKPFGIPVNRAFDRKYQKNWLKRKLGLIPDKKYLLIVGGSVGAGHLSRTVEALLWCIGKREDYGVIVICGNNKKLFRKINRRYKNQYPVVVLNSTNRMADYMKACELVFSKPGGLSSTEAVTAGVPLVHIVPIPGCETKNRTYFAKRKISAACWNGDWHGIRKIRKLILQNEIYFNREHIHTNARNTLCDWLEQIIAQSQSAQESVPH